MLRAACAQAIEWDREGLPPVHLAVNVSARQFRQKDFVQAVHHILDETGFDPRRLKLEITESLIMCGAEDFISVLGALKDLGLKLAIDDFGTGYSSLSYLHRFPIDELKIDRFFLQGIGSEGGDTTVPRTIISWPTACAWRSRRKASRRKPRCASSSPTAATRPRAITSRNQASLRQFLACCGPIIGGPCRTFHDVRRAGWKRRYTHRR